jgi:transcriptional regulator GlxA family with amidase domain
MPLLKDSIHIMTVPPSPQRQLTTLIKDLRVERAKLSRLFTILFGRLSLEEAHLLRLRAATILYEFDDMLNELEFILHEVKKE